MVIWAAEQLSQYCSQVGALGAEQAVRLMSMALNSEGNKSRTEFGRR